MRHYLVSGFNKLISCFIQFEEEYLNMLKYVQYLKSEWAVIIAMYKWSNLFGLTWNLVCMLYTYGSKCCANFMIYG